MSFVSDRLNRPRRKGRPQWARQQCAQSVEENMRRYFAGFGEDLPTFRFVPAGVGGGRVSADSCRADRDARQPDQGRRSARPQPQHAAQENPRTWRHGLPVTAPGLIFPIATAPLDTPCPEVAFSPHSVACSQRLGSSAIGMARNTWQSTPRPDRPMPAWSTARAMPPVPQWTRQARMVRPVKVRHRDGAACSRFRDRTRRLGIPEVPLFPLRSFSD